MIKHDLQIGSLQILSRSYATICVARLGIWPGWLNLKAEYLPHYSADCYCYQSTFHTTVHTVTATRVPSTLQCRLLLLQQPPAFPTVMAAHHHLMLTLTKLQHYLHYPYMPSYLTANSKENNFLLYGSLDLMKSTPKCNIYTISMLSFVSYEKINLKIQVLSDWTLCHMANNSEERSAIIFRHLFFDCFTLKMVLCSFHKSGTMWPMAYNHSHKCSSPNNIGWGKIDHRYKEHQLTI
jgi:hypothetical protein